MEVQVDIKCTSCNEPLEVNGHFMDKWGKWTIEVFPCQKCSWADKQVSFANREGNLG